MIYDRFKKKVLTNLIRYKVCDLDILEDVSWNGNQYEYILPNDFAYKNFMFSDSKQYIEDNHIKLRRGYSHLNSSQVMCINYFKPLIDESLIGRFLEGIIKDISGMKVEECEFEHKNLIDGTHVEFYVKLSNARVFIETKYTESRFARGIDDIIHMKKVEEMYNEMAKKSKYFKNGLPKDFLENYQIYRYILQIQEDSDYAIFIYPFDNESLKEQIDKILCDKNYNNVICLDWKEISKDDRYKEFYKKYLNY